MSAKSFISDVEELGWTRKRLAETLGISTETLRVWMQNGPPEVGRIAVAALASGWRP
jgi:predicted site-specific integrase-resolvase